MSNEVVIDLPMCPTTNNLYRGTGKKRVKTYKYEAWEREAGWELLRQHPPRIKGAVALVIEVSERESTDTWDVCNREKATTDLLVTHGVIQGDNRPIVRRVTMEWSDVPGVRVTITPLRQVDDVSRETGETHDMNAAMIAIAEEMRGLAK